jgi:preprotein translocase subunit SecY
MYPLKLLYVSVLPVILASALLMNVQIIAKPVFLNANWDVGGVNIAHYIAYVNPSNGAISDGLLYFLTPFGNPLYTGYETYLQMLTMPTPIFQIPQIIHILVYLVVYVTICVFFGKFWIEAAGMGPETIAGQITQAGLSRPGFRTDPRIIQSMLERYIPTVAVIGSIFVGFLAVFADLTGAIGTGTGILLTVSIIYKFYEDFERQNIFESHPMLHSLFGSRS